MQPIFQIQASEFLRLLTKWEPSPTVRMSHLISVFQLLAPLFFRCCPTLESHHQLIAQSWLS